MSNFYNLIRVDYLLRRSKKSIAIMIRHQELFIQMTFEILYNLNYHKLEIRIHCISFANF